MSPRRVGALAVILIALLGACGDAASDGDEESTTTSAAAAADPDTVVLKGIEFRPERISVQVGDTVTWRWDDGNVPHDVNGGDDFKSEVKESGTFEHTFAEPGVYEYKCTVHPAMTGAVEVTE